MRFYLGTHEVTWLARTDVPLFISRRRLWKRKTFPKAIGTWALDSGGFSELSMYGEWRTPLYQYAEEVERFSVEIGNMEWAAPQDWMCEPWIVEATGLSVEEHQFRTVENYMALKVVAPELPWVPVLQGWTVQEYANHVQMYLGHGIDLSKLPLVGIGSVCRRQQTKGGREVIEMVHEAGINVHAFGLKLNGLSAIGNLIASSDSMAWSFRARRRPPLPECTHIKCNNCILFALDWREKLIKKLANEGVSVIDEGSGMTEGQATNQTYIAIDETGKATSRRAHLFQDCSFLEGEKDIKPIGTSEMALLGLKVCSVCERRQTGGPAIEALKEIASTLDDAASDVVSDQIAWDILNGLKQRGFYIAQRRSQ